MTKDNSMLSVLKAQGVSLPQKEQLNEPTLSMTIFERMKKLSRECGNEEAPYLLEEFNALVYDYPYSMLASHVTENEATLVCLYYFYRPRSTGKYRGTLSDWEFSKLTEQEQQHYIWDRMSERMEKEDYHFYSYEELAVLFGRSKATVHAIIQGHKDRVKLLLDADRIEARKIAMEQLIVEEEAKLRNSEEND